MLSPIEMIIKNMFVMYQRNQRSIYLKYDVFGKPLLIDPSKDEAVIEWTHFKTKLGITLRGAEWYLFDKSSGLIKELWAYYASPQDKNLKTLELKGMNYVSRGFPKSPPPGER